MNRLLQPRLRRRPHCTSRRYQLLLCLLILLPLGTAACHQSPLTGRNQLVLIPEEQEVLLGQQAYEAILAEHPLSQHRQYQEIVERVGQRLTAVAERPDLDWEFRVLAGNQQNAFALPGGKVAIYEGLLPICANEAGLAVVLSHEMAHVLARHGAERMSQTAAVQGLGGVLDAVTREQDVPDQQKIVQAYGAAAHLGIILPYSRQHETEADSIGLTLMARAGYDPREAPRFWERLAAATGSRPPELLSTHPSDENRARHLAELLSTAQTYYEHAASRYGLGAVIPQLPPTSHIAARPATVPTAAPSTVATAAPSAVPAPDLAIRPAAARTASLKPPLASAAPVVARSPAAITEPAASDATGESVPASENDSDAWELPQQGKTGIPSVTPPSTSPKTSAGDGWVPTGRRGSQPQ